MTEHARAAAMRWVVFLCLWLAIFHVELATILVGAVTAAAATWTSLHLLPPGTARLRPLALAEFALRFVRQSAISGADVARRALDPRLPLRPGFVRCPLRLPPGAARDGFCTLASLLPGTLPVGSDPDAALRVHCLDLGQDVAAQMNAEETAFLATFRAATGDG
jgi:multicomponent Na+:H+ antiporter subunit E